MRSDVNRGSIRSAGEISSSLANQVPIHGPLPANRVKCLGRWMPFDRPQHSALTLVHLLGQALDRGEQNELKLCAKRARSPFLLRKLNVREGGEGDCLVR